MNKVAKKWIAALRSRKYKQGNGQLLENGKHCCLGVLCELAVKEGVIKDFIPSSVGIPDKVMKWAGLRTSMAQYVNRRGQEAALWKDNDGYEGYGKEISVAHKPFSKIAKIIESNPKGLFNAAHK